MLPGHTASSSNENGWFFGGCLDGSVTTKRRPSSAHCAALGGLCRWICLWQSWSAAGRDRHATSRPVASSGNIVMFEEALNASVVIPSHNRASSLSRTIEAICTQQTTRSFEVIVALDDCTDSSATM